MQERAGLDVVNDGEWRRRSYIGVIAELAHGFTLETNPADGRPWTVVTEKLSPKPAGFVAAEAKFVKQVGAGRDQDHPARPGAARRAAVGRRSARAPAYPTRDAFVRDCVAPLRAEIALMQDMGVEIVQIDDPHLCLFVDPDVRAPLRRSRPRRRFRRRHDQRDRRGLRAASSSPSISAAAPARACAARSTMPAPTGRSCRSSIA